MKVNTFNFLPYIFFPQETFRHNSCKDEISKLHHIKTVSFVACLMILLEFVKALIAYLTHITDIMSQKLEVENFGQDSTLSFPYFALSKGDATAAKLSKPFQMYLLVIWH